MEKTSGDIIILHMCTKNNDHMMYSSWNIVRGWKDTGSMDGQTENVTYSGGCPT